MCLRAPCSYEENVVNSNSELQGVAHQSRKHLKWRKRLLSLVSILQDADYLAMFLGPLLVTFRQGTLEGCMHPVIQAMFEAVPCESLMMCVLLFPGMFIEGMSTTSLFYCSGFLWPSF